MGKPVGTTWTKLKKVAKKGATKITVVEFADWKVGDWIVIAPTENKYREADKRQITAINAATGEITLNAALDFFHFGDELGTYGTGSGYRY